MQMCVGLVADGDAGVAQFTDLIPIHKSAEFAVDRVGRHKECERQSCFLQPRKASR